MILFFDFFGGGLQNLRNGEDCWNLETLRKLGNLFQTPGTLYITPFTTCARVDQLPMLDIGHLTFNDGNRYFMGI